MNAHSYILVFHKPITQRRGIIKNRPVRYRKKLQEKLEQNTTQNGLKKAHALRSLQ